MGSESTGILLHIPLPQPLVKMCTRVGTLQGLSASGWLEYSCSEQPQGPVGGSGGVWQAEIKRSCGIVFSSCCQLPVSICVEHTWVKCRACSWGHAAVGTVNYFGGQGHLLLFCRIKCLSSWGLPIAQWKSKVSECGAFRAFPLMFQAFLPWSESLFLKSIFPVAWCKRSCSGSSGRKE